MSYPTSSSTESGLHQIQRLFIRLILVVTGLFLISFTLALVIPILLLSAGDSLQWQFFNLEFIPPSFHYVELEIFGHASESPIYIICLSLLIGIPIGMIFYTGIRFIVGLSYSHTLGSTAFHVWLFSLILLVFFAIKGINNTNHDKLLNKNSPSQINMIQKGIEMATYPFRKTKEIEINATR